MPTVREKREAFRGILASPGGEASPSAYDPLSAMLIARAGFRVVTVSANGLHHSQGFGDLGLLSLTEQVARAGAIADAVDVPVISDCEVAGTVLNVARAVREFERAGLAAIDLEDEEIPPRATAYRAGECLSIEAFADRIKAAVDSRTDPSFSIIARMESRDEPYERVVARGLAAAEAGADALWIGHVSQPDMPRIVRDMPRPMVGVARRLRVPAAYLALGYKVAILPGAVARAACWGMESVLRLLKEGGSEDEFYASHPGGREIAAWFESIGGGPAHEI